MNDTRKEVLKTALDKLKQEMEKELLSLERVAALVRAIEVLKETNPLSQW